MSRPTAVVFRALGLGDFITALPALAMLRQALPAHRLVLATPGHFRDLLPLGVRVDEVVPTGELEPIPAVARRLVDAGHDVVATGSPNEAGLVAELARAGSRPLTGLSLVELCGLVASASLVVCGDTGVAHVASAYRTPSVVLMGPVSPARWGPPDDPRHVALWHGGEGDPHAHRPDGGLLAITVAEVWDAVAGLIDLSFDPVSRTTPAEVGA